jgi:hypothetical protein
MLTIIRAKSVAGVMSPNPTVEKTVMVKYSACVWSSRWLNAAAEAWDRGQVDAREHDQEQRQDHAEGFHRPQLGQLGADDPAGLPRHDQGEQPGADPQAHEGAGVRGAADGHQVVDPHEHDPRQGHRDGGMKESTPSLALVQLGQPPGCHTGPASAATRTNGRRSSRAPVEPSRRQRDVPVPGSHGCAMVETLATQDDDRLASPLRRASLLRAQGRRAISGSSAPVKSGPSRSLTDSPPRSSGGMAARTAQIPKLIVRVRFPSPAPQ